MYQGYPVIGILGKYSSNFECYTISHAFIHWFQSSGCYVLYISPLMNNKTILKILNEIDGVLLPAGNDHPFEDCLTYQKAKLIMDYGIENPSFPILGICMGFQYMLTYFSHNDWNSIKYVINNIGHSLPLIIHKKNDLFKTIPNELFDKNLFNFNHQHCILKKTFENNERLKSLFNVLSTTKYNKKEFITSIESKKHSFLGFQWHPEKANYEWSPFQTITREPESILIGQIVSSYFISLCTKYNNKKTTSKILKDYSIENLDTKHVEFNGNQDIGYDQEIFFKKI